MLLKSHLSLTSSHLKELVAGVFPTLIQQYSQTFLVTAHSGIFLHYQHCWHMFEGHRQLFLSLSSAITSPLEVHDSVEGFRHERALSAATDKFSITNWNTDVETPLRILLFSHNYSKAKTTRITDTGSGARNVMDRVWKKTFFTDSAMFFAENALDANIFPPNRKTESRALALNVYFFFTFLPEMGVRLLRLCNDTDALASELVLTMISFLFGCLCDCWSQHTADRDLEWQNSGDFNFFAIRTFAMTPFLAPSRFNGFALFFIFWFLLRVWKWSQLERYVFPSTFFASA